MGFFTRTAMDMLMKTTHPEINRRQCWNLHPHRKPCTECKDICPYGEQIFTRPNLVKDWDPCTECGLCVSACRAGALKLEDLPDGQTRIVITPWKCSECEVCVASCSNHGINGMKLRQLTTLGPVSVHKCTKTLCKECGKPIAPGSVDGVCTVCRIKARTKKRQEEAAAKAKQLREEREAKKAAEEAAKAAAEAGADAAETAVQTAAAPAETAAAAAVPAAAGSVITALTPEKAAPAALDETPAAAPENTAEKDVPDTPKND